jgi:hypothetical protein
MCLCTVHHLMLPKKNISSRAAGSQATQQHPPIKSAIKHLNIRYQSLAKNSRNGYLSSWLLVSSAIVKIPESSKLVISFMRLYPVSHIFSRGFTLSTTRNSASAVDSTFPSPSSICPFTHIFLPSFFSSLARHNTMPGVLRGFL